MTAASKRRFRIGIDVGGTFTDFVLADMDTGKLVHFKEPSVPSDPSLAVATGMAGLLAKGGVDASQVELVVHGMTLALNAIIQRRGAKIALIVSEGFRDVLEIGRSRMADAHNLFARKEEPLVPRNLVFELPARVRYDGTELARPSAADLDKLARQLGEAEVAAVSVMLLHSYLHPALEQWIAGELRRRLPDVLVAESARIWPEIREYERALVTVLNSYVHPLMDTYLTRLKTRLSEMGIKAPVYITASNGGTMSLATAAERPIETTLSGPASGVIAATRVAGIVGERKIITFDMGGTSSDIALSISGEPEYTTRTMIGDFPLVLPVVNVSAIGAGGGSIVWVDPQGVLKVGPESAGAHPGPACYGRGGTLPTLTDCYLTVGYFDPDHFLGGRMKLDREASRRALESIANTLGLTGPDRAERAAEAALDVATAVMTTELATNLSQRGEDPKTFALMPFGGAGPTQANRLAREAGISSLVIPRAPGTFCAMGAILADVKRDYLRSLRIALVDDGDALQALAAKIGEMEREAANWIVTEGDALGEPVYKVSADMRYAGQAFEITVDVPADLAADWNLEALRELLHRGHEALYGFRDTDTIVELMTLRLRVSAQLLPLPIPPIAQLEPTLEAATRSVFTNGRFMDVPVLRRDRLAPNQRFEGPAIVEQDDSTCWILPGWSAKVEQTGNLLVALVETAGN